MSTRSSLHAWFEREWQDQVASTDGHLGRFDEDVDAFVRDMKDVVRMVVEVTAEPLRAFAEPLPRAMAFEANGWSGSLRRGMKHARSSWR